MCLLLVATFPTDFHISNAIYFSELKNMERDFNKIFNDFVECASTHDPELPNGKSIDFVSKIAVSLHILESSVDGLLKGKSPDEIIIQEEINLSTLKNAAYFISHINEVKESLANVSIIKLIGTIIQISESMRVTSRMSVRFTFYPAIDRGADMVDV